MATDAPARQRTFLGHPLGLYVLFLTEMWERFSFYGMKALLMVYMLNYFRWTQPQAAYAFKMYSSLVYVTPLLGGYLADRYLGNRRAVIIGALLMAAGHFFMAFEETPIFLTALVFLIFGNGFFKPNMSTQVGRLYPTGDGRRDGAYTIFYMGINLGACLAPLTCGWLAQNTVGGYHSGFTMAGIGMVVGLIIYLVGQPLIKEIPQGVHVASGEPNASVVPSPVAAGFSLRDERRLKPAATGTAGTGAPALTEAEAAQEPSRLGKLSKAVPTILFALGGFLLGLALTRAAMSIWGDKDIFDAVAIGIGAGCLLLIGHVARTVHGSGVRDRLLAILILGIFVIFFWGAFEQGGNVLNIWADQFTNRYLTHEMQDPDRLPRVDEGKADQKEGRLGYWDRFVRLFPDMVTLKATGKAAQDIGWGETIERTFNPIPTAWFLSINAVLIVLLAPLFAWAWSALDRRGLQPSIPMKMAMGLAFVCAGMSVMMEAAREEHQTSAIAWHDFLPSGVALNDQQQLTRKERDKQVPFNAGRLTLDREGKKFVLVGVLDKNVCDLIIEATAPERYQKIIEELQKDSKRIGGGVESVEIVLDDVPPGFDMKYSGLKKAVVEFHAAAGRSGKLVAYKTLAQKEVRGLKMAAGAPKFRDAMLDLYVESSRFRVSMAWLFWAILLNTLGELCLSPVGLSMVSKLAPARFATMMMGFWLIISFFGNFAAGAMGEIWGTVRPINFFLLTAVVVGSAALLLLVLVRGLTAIMHGVK